MPVQRELVERQRVIHTAMCAPAVRTVLVVVTAWIDDDVERTDPPATVTRVEVVPVLAMKSVLYRVYAIWADKAGDARRMFGTEDEAVKQGWQLVEQREEVRPVFASYVGDCPGLTDGTDLPPLTNGATRVVAAPWPPAEDEERLAGVVERLRKEAREVLLEDLAEGRRLYDTPATGRRG
jgi:hypothetical protein